MVKKSYQRIFLSSKISTSSIISIYILHLLAKSNEPMYGKEIARAIEDRTTRWDKYGKPTIHGYQVSRGILYGSLRELEKRGLATGAWEQLDDQPTNKKTRYLYCITDEGKEFLTHFKLQEKINLDNAIYIMEQISNDITG